MLAYVVLAFIGILISILGIVNMTGNISSLHWYHRQRVTEENRKPFGRLVGSGTLIIGISMLIAAVIIAIGELAAIPVLVGIGTGVVVVGAVAGIAVSFYAMIKYNKGIF
ncbi:MAG: hypothetical protein IJZ83_07860 [Clostridia bacterium]|nr:hypothetical protein [Clostridia bacterium]